MSAHIIVFIGLLRMATRWRSGSLNIAFYRHLGSCLHLYCSPCSFWFFFVLHLFSNWVFGFVGLLLNILIFYYCIGLGNPFYPVRESTAEHASNDEIGTYLVQSNGQLFAVLFWYIVLGPLAVLAYRLIALSQGQAAVGQQATWVTNLLDWLPARMTALLYMLVGNFQAGLRHFSKLVFSVPAKNPTLISECGLQALGCGVSEPVRMPQAESLVEHAVIALLVLLAFFTLVAWV